jgi:type I restriction enzyme S subunit
MTIPSGWTQTSVGELAASFRSGDAFLKLEYTVDGIPVLAKGDIKPFGRLEHSERRFLEASIAESRGYRLTEPDDLLVTTRDLTQKADVLGLASPVPQDQPYLVNQGANVLRLKNPELNRYLVYWTNGPIYRDFMRANFVGSTQIHIRHGDVLRAPVWLPPDGERGAIVELLGSLDDKIEQNRRTSRALEKLARATFKAWFVDFEPVKVKAAGATSFPGMPQAAFAALPDCLTDTPFGAVPQGWTVGKLGDHCRINEQSVRVGEIDGDIEYIDIASVTVGRLDRVQRLPFPEAPGRARRRVRHGDTIWSCVRPNRRSYLFIHSPLENCIVSTGFAVLSPASFRPSYLHELTTRQEFVDYLVSNADGSAYPAVRPDHFAAADVLVPQVELRDAFEEVTMPLRNLLAAGEAESSKLAALRDYLLPQLLSGAVRMRPSRAEAEG